VAGTWSARFRGPPWQGRLGRVEGREAAVQWTLEVVQVPVADVDRAKAFYADQVGFVVDFDVATDAEHRFVQLTPPGSGCSIQLSTGYHDDLVPGSARGLTLVVPDVRAAQAHLTGGGVATSGVVVVADDGRSSRPARDGDALDNVGVVHFADPDGNRWTVQQISSRAVTHDLAEPTVQEFGCGTAEARDVSRAGLE
jgi:catechol 2,3-dioxygenase-like lactoylglutathione lyase family enzyme